MNQILQSKENGKGKIFTSSKNIIIIIVGIIIISGLAFGGYTICKNILNGNITLPWGKAEPEDAPDVIFKTTEDNQLVLEVKSIYGIDSIIYNWDNELPQELKIEGKKHIEKEFKIPQGENTLYVSVKDVNGVEIQRSEKTLLESPKPIIDLSVVGNDIKITITSEVELSEIRYKWNEDEEKKENMITYENRLSYEKKLEIPVGQNNLTIVATDINGGITEKTQAIKGVTKTTTTTEVKGKYLHFTIIGKENIQKVEFEFNGKKYLMNTDTYGETKKVHYKVELISGMNNIEITSTTRSGGVENISYQYEYTK